MIIPWAYIRHLGWLQPTTLGSSTATAGAASVVMVASSGCCAGTSPLTSPAGDSGTGSCSEAAAGLAGVAVAGVVVAAGVGVHYATRNPGKAVAVGALAIGGIALATHIGEVGVAEAAEHIVEGVGDFVEGVAGASSEVVEAGEELTEAFLDDAMADAFLDAADRIEDIFDDGVEILAELF